MISVLEETGRFVKLPNRGLVRVSGPDRVTFLQNLVTNDVRLLETQRSVYACFLTPQGKFLHDFYMTQDGDAILLECEGGARAEDLLKKLKPYKLRIKVELSYEPEIAVYDTPAGRTFAKPDLPELSFDEWDQRRIRSGKPDGSRDMEVGKDTIMECNIDRFGGVSFEKGCYVGQEITARMKLRGLVKKRLYPVEWTANPAPEPFTDIHINGQLLGQMRSHCGNIGLALLKEDELDSLANSPLRLI